jgi:small-conductance mechanosensitive channel
MNTDLTVFSQTLFKSFGESGLHFELWVWAEHIDKRTSIKSALNFLIEYQFRLHHIKMAYRPVEPWLTCNHDLALKRKREVM